MKSFILILRVLKPFRLTSDCYKLSYYSHWSIANKNLLTEYFTSSTNTHLKSAVSVHHTGPCVPATTETITYLNECINTNRMKSIRAVLYKKFINTFDQSELTIQLWCVIKLNIGRANILKLFKFDISSHSLESIHQWEENVLLCSWIKWIIDWEIFLLTFHGDLTLQVSVNI